MFSPRIAPWLVIALSVPAFTGQNCGIQSNDQPPDPCSRQEVVALDKTLISEGESDTLREYFLHTGPARSACHAHYTLYFDRVSRKDHSHDADSLPFNTEHAFRPGGLEGLLFYFPSPKPTLHTDGPRPVWSIVFDIGNKNSSSDTTDYTVGFYLPQSSDDTIDVRGTIVYSRF